MKNLKDYRIVLTIWIALGITITGLLYIFPDKVHYSSSRRSRVKMTYSKNNYTKSKVSALVTTVGVLLIGGIGYVSDKK